MTWAKIDAGGDILETWFFGSRGAVFQFASGRFHHRYRDHIRKASCIRGKVNIGGSSRPEWLIILHSGIASVVYLDAPSPDQRIRLLFRRVLAQ
jgi:hypothetical protein